MTSFGERLAVVTALAFLAALTVIAVLEQTDESAARTAVRGAAAPTGGWYGALAASRGVAGDAEHTTCGLVEVIDNKLKGQGRQFELTEALARRLGLDGTQAVSWRFASAGAR